jgi:L-malate glycosyltransferase
MKVLLLAGGSSVHTIRWANALAQAGVQVVLATQHACLETLVPAIRVHRLPYSGGTGYFRNVFALKRILADEKPDLLNAHYASGYGTTARLARFAPTLLSVWGSDVFDFPGKSTPHRLWLRGNLMAATRVASTSHAMAEQTRHVAPSLGEIAITPFGVETVRFKPRLHNAHSGSEPIVIGTVKSLKPIYGIDVLIESVALLISRLRREAPQLAERIAFQIVGDGPEREALKRQVVGCGIEAITRFDAGVRHDEVPAVLRELDVYAALSRQESFGVAVIEAGACGLPVVVSDVGGLPEVVVDGETGIVVPSENPVAAAAALHRLVLDIELRRVMGHAARKRVISIYEWRDNVRTMIDLYEEVIAKFQRTTPS